MPFGVSEIFKVPTRLGQYINMFFVSLYIVSSGSRLILMDEHKRVRLIL